jgi:hypothetical protein
MKMEKKIIAICMCALAIGLATALPLTHFTPRIATAQNNDPLFDLRVDYVYFYATADDDYYQCKTVIGIEPLINIDAFNQQAGTRIEYFVITYYTDEQQLAKQLYYIGANSSYIENTETLMNLGRNELLDEDLLRLNSGGVYLFDIPYILSNNSSLGVWQSADGKSVSIDEKYLAILEAIENKQTIYMDITRVGYTTFDGNDIVLTIINNPVVIQHIEMTKNGEAFIFGNTEGIDPLISSIVDRS